MIVGIVEVLGAVEVMVQQGLVRDDRKQQIPHLGQLPKHHAGLTSPLALRIAPNHLPLLSPPPIERGHEDTQQAIQGRVQGAQVGTELLAADLGHLVGDLIKSVDNLIDSDSQL